MKLRRFDAPQSVLAMGRAVLIAGLLMLAGCFNSDAPPKVGSAPPTVAPVPPGETLPVETLNVTLEVQSPEEIEKLIASHMGKIVVIDLWTLW